MNDQIRRTQANEADTPEARAARAEAEANRQARARTQPPTPKGRWAQITAETRATTEIHQIARTQIARATQTEGDRR